MILTKYPLTQIFQLLFTASPISYSNSRQIYHSSTSYSPPANVLEELGICESPPPFPTGAPVSGLHKMALVAEAKRVAAQFELSDEDVRKNVDEFISEMSASYHEGFPSAEL